MSQFSSTVTVYDAYYNYAGWDIGYVYAGSDFWGMAYDYAGLTYVSNYGIYYYYGTGYAGNYYYGAYWYH